MFTFVPVAAVLDAQSKPPAVQLEFENRFRIERRTDRDFNEANRDNLTEFSDRYRIGVRMKGSDGWTGFLQHQYARTRFFKTGGDPATLESADLLQAHAQRKVGDETLTIGRQRINFGTERLVGSLEWVNNSRSFDGFRLQKGPWDAFAARIAVQRRRPKEARLVGVSRVWGQGATSLIYKHDKPAAGNVDLWTLSHAHKGALAGFAWEGELALQGGDASGKDQEAWAVHWAAERPLSAKTKLMVEVNAASGGGSGDTTQTFDNLYPTNHKFYGIMDLHAWKNVEMVAVQVTHKARPDLDFKARWQTSRLHDAKDAWYSAGGTPNRHAGGAFIDPTGASGRNLGQELDIEVFWKSSPNATLSAGIATFLPGGFVKKEAGDDKAQVFGYVQFGVRF